MVGAPSGRWIAPMDRVLRMRVLSWFVSQNLSSIMAKTNKDDLNLMAELMQSGKVTPVIDRRYRLSEVPEALLYLEEGHARGKVVIILESGNGAN
jgi:NADPH:quinone reductase-like Zn-dependent oxidoreductase